MRKITIGIWDFESISREGTVREKGIQGVVYEERWIRHCRISVVVSQISSTWLRYFASYFQINFLQVNKIITVTGDFKFKHWSIRWIDRSNFLIKSVFKSNQKRLFSNKSRELWVASLGNKLAIIFNVWEKISSTSHWSGFSSNGCSSFSSPYWPSSS